MNPHLKLTQLKLLAKYGITALTALGVVHCVLLYLGYDIFILHLIVCAFLFIVGMSLSRVFDLCWVHKLCVTYVASILVCITLKRHGIIPNVGHGVQTARFIMACVGSLLVILTIWKARNKRKC